MKKVYKNLEKNEKEKMKSKYYKTKTGKYVKSRLFIAFISFAGCEILGIITLIDYIFNTKSIWDLVYSISLIGVGLIFLIMRNIIFNKKINEYVK